MLRNGGWWNPIRANRDERQAFPTPSGRFEFYSQALKRSVDAAMSSMDGGPTPENLEVVLDSLDITTRGDAAFMPHHEPPPTYQDDDMPLVLTTFQVSTNRDGHASNSPSMQEMFGYTARQYWRSWVEINPETAAAFRIHDGDWVWVESLVGTVRVQAYVHPGIAPNTVAMPFGLGHTAYGRYAAGHGANPHSIIRNHYDRLSGKPATQATKVRISHTA
jgi:anaerobic selenocysteine-containing dehydrogenase